MSFDNDTKEQMDEAAEKAKADFAERSQSGKMKTAEDVVSWIADWYREAGHRRINRFLLSSGLLKKN